MKQLTPSGWIGVLIGIVVFGSIVCRVTSSSSLKCYKANAKSDGSANDKITSVELIKEAFAKEKWTIDCNKKCAQYFIPQKDDTANHVGKVQVVVECGKCADSPAASRIGPGYQCHDCDNLSACKTIDDVKTPHVSECYDYSGAGNDKDLTTLPKIYCMDKCAFVIKTAVLTVGCKKDVNTATSTLPTDCPADDLLCEKKISLSKCWKPDGNNNKIDSVTDISEAYEIKKWNVVCKKGYKCNQYYPPAASDSANRIGKVQVLVECGDKCLENRELTDKMSPGYRCHQCDSNRPDNCIKVETDVKTATECYSHTSTKKNSVDDIRKEKKIYCMDKCQYIESGNTFAVGCEDDLKKTSAGNSAVNCPSDDKLCEKMILKPTSGGGASGNNQNPTTAAPTAAPKHGNRVTVPTCLTGSMAILLFAASQYVTILN